MTDNLLLGLFAGLAVATIALFFLLRKSVRNAEQAKRLRENVYHLAGALIEDRQMVPDRIAEVAHWMAGTVLDGKFARDLFWALLTGELNSYADKKPSEQWSTALRSMPEERRRQFFELCANYVIATSYKSAFMGPILRRVIVHIANNAETSEAIVLDEYDDNNPGHSFAAA